MHHYTDRSYHEIEDTLHDYITVHVIEITFEKEDHYRTKLYWDS